MFRQTDMGLYHHNGSVANSSGDHPFCISTSVPYTFKKEQKSVLYCNTQHVIYQHEFHHSTDLGFHRSCLDGMLFPPLGKVLSFITLVFLHHVSHVS